MWKRLHRPCAPSSKIPNGGSRWGTTVDAGWPSTFLGGSWRLRWRAPMKRSFGSNGLRDRLCGKLPNAMKYATRKQNWALMVNRLTLTLVFTLSFLAFTAPELTVFLQLLPLVLFAALVFFKVLCSDSAFKAVRSLFEIDGLLFVFFLSVFIVGPSVSSAYSNSLGVALLISLFLVLGRLFLFVVPVR